MRHAIVAVAVALAACGDPPLRPTPAPAPDGERCTPQPERMGEAPDFGAGCYQPDAGPGGDVAPDGTGEDECSCETDSECELCGCAGCATETEGLGHE